MTKILDMHKKWLKDPEYAREYDVRLRLTEPGPLSMNAERI
jgi:hypothetical protein